MKRFIYLIVVLLIVSSQTLFAQHLKKDGTPDRRYKENKTTIYSPSASTSTSDNSTGSELHLKKDGTPDKRFKENKKPSITYTTTNTPAPSYNTSNSSDGVARDNNGRIKRNESAKRKFMKDTGYPHGRPGYVVDHITPLYKGGCDCPENMQWQTIPEAKEKDKVER